MSKRAFFLKLGLSFSGPFFALFALPVAIGLASGELEPITWLAERHAHASASTVYGAAYNNPDKAYKFASIVAHRPKLLAVGTSRIMQVRSDFFVDGDRDFYNAGGVVTRIFDYRILFRRLAALDTRRAIVSLDQWAFNDAWEDFAPDGGVDREYDGDYSSLYTIQHLLLVYPDLYAGKFKIRDVFFGNGFGVNALSHGNGFRRDGSYFYADLLREASQPGYHFHDEDTLERIRAGTRRFEPGVGPSKVALAELDALASRWNDEGFEVVAFLPPYAPMIVEKMRAAGDRLAWVFQIGSAVREVLERHGVPVVDFTTCGDVGCVDDDFIDGFHGGSVLYAKMLLEMSHTAPWLEQAIARDSLERRIPKASTWELPLP